MILRSSGFHFLRLRKFVSIGQLNLAQNYSFTCRQMKFKNGQELSDDGLASAVRKGMAELSQTVRPGGGSYVSRPLEDARSDKYSKSVRQLSKEEQYSQAMNDLFEEQCELGPDGMMLEGFAVDLASVSLSSDLAELTVFWALSDDQRPITSPEVKKLVANATPLTLPSIEAKILQMINRRLCANAGYFRSVLASRVNSKKVPHLLFRHFSERDPITRAAYKNFRYDSYVDNFSETNRNPLKKSSKRGSLSANDKAKADDSVAKSSMRLRLTKRH